MTAQPFHAHVRLPHRPPIAQLRALGNAPVAITLLDAAGSLSSATSARRALPSRRCSPCPSPFGDSRAGPEPAAAVPPAAPAAVPAAPLLNSDAGSMSMCMGHLRRPAAVAAVSRSMVNRFTFCATPYESKAQRQDLRSHATHGPARADSALDLPMVCPNPQTVRGHALHCLRLTASTSASAAHLQRRGQL